VRVNVELYRNIPVALDRPAEGDRSDEGNPCKGVNQPFIANQLPI